MRPAILIVSLAGCHAGLAAVERLMGDDKPIGLVEPGTTPDCVWWHDNQDGSWACRILPGMYGISSQDFLAWNPSLAPNCENYKVGYSYCVEVSPQPATTSTISANPGQNTATTLTSTRPTTITTTTTTTSISTVSSWKPTTTTTSAGNGIETPVPNQPGMVNNCNKFHFVKTTTTCQSLMDYYSLPWADLLRWNPGIGNNCENLWSGTYVCVGTLGGSPTITTSTAVGNGIATPTPIQDGMVNNCNKFHLVKTTTSCQSLMDYYSLPWASLYKWNPAIGSSCGSLWANTYVCVGVVGGSPTTSAPTAPGNGIATPTPIQQGMVNNCNKFHLVKTTTTCQSLMDYYSLPWASLFKWNPAIGSTCGSLWANTYVCVGVVGGSPPPSTTVGNGVATPTPIQAGMVTNCNKFHLIKTTTTCQSLMDYYSLPWASLFKWNPAIGSTCASLWSGTYACVGVIGGTTPPSTTVGNGITTPTPIQAGMVTNCNKFHLVKTTTTCESIMDYYSITWANLFKWNPAVGKDCTSLWANTYACVGVK